MTRTIAALGAVAMLLLTVTPAFAGEPDPGHADLFQHDPGDARLVLDWHFGSMNYPAWFRSSVESELETFWQDAAGNNSGAPRFDNGGDNSGGGSLVYTAAAASPCTGSPTWLGCNPAGGVRGFSIYVRSIPSVSAPTWMFFQRDGTCSDLYDGNPNPDDGFPTSLCFSVMRVTAHEATHLTLLRSHYEAAEEWESFMMGRTPTAAGSPDYWNRRFFLPCDLAAAQLEYGLADPAGRYANCFDVTPGDGSKGLNSTLTLATAATVTRCWNQAVSVSGRLALADVAAYEDLGDTPLEGRIVRIDRRPINSTTWTNGLFTATASDATGPNWSRSITTSTAGTFVYRATFLTTAAETGVNSSPSAMWTIQWSTIGCPS